MGEVTVSEEHMCLVSSQFAVQVAAGKQRTKENFHGLT